MAKRIHIQQGVGTFEEREDGVLIDELAPRGGAQLDLLDMDDMGAVAGESPASLPSPPQAPQPVAESLSVSAPLPPVRDELPVVKPRRGRPKGTAGKGNSGSRPRVASVPDLKQRSMFTVVSLLIPPILISFISALHMFEFFLMANPPFMAIVLAVSYEILNIAVLVAIWQFSIMSRGTRMFIWTALIALVALLVVGNCYANYLHLDPESISKFAAQWGLPNDVTTSRVLALLHGSLLPLTTVAFVKAVANYWMKTEKK